MIVSCVIRHSMFVSVCVCVCVCVCVRARARVRVCILGQDSYGFFVTLCGDAEMI